MNQCPLSSSALSVAYRSPSRIQLEPGPRSCRRQAELGSLDRVAPVPGLLLVNGPVGTIRALGARLASPPLLPKYSDGRAIRSDGIGIHDLQPTRAIAGRADRPKAFRAAPVRQRKGGAVDHNEANGSLPHVRAVEIVTADWIASAVTLRLLRKSYAPCRLALVLHTSSTLPAGWRAASAARCTSLRVRRESPRSA